MMIALNTLQSELHPKKNPTIKNGPDAKLPNSTNYPTSNLQQLLSVLALHVRCLIWYCVSVKCFYNSS